MSQEKYNGSSVSVTISPKDKATNNPAPVTAFLSIETECKKELADEVIKKWAYPSQEGFSNFHIADDNLSLDATLSAEETEDLPEGAYTVTTKMVYADERFEDNKNTNIKKGLWFIIKKK